jgi:hypothetical protein
VLGEFTGNFGLTKLTRYPSLMKSRSNTLISKIKRKNSMKKTYSSPRLTEYGTVSEITHMFGSPILNDNKRETGVDSQSGSTGTGSDSPTIG